MWKLQLQSDEAILLFFSLAVISKVKVNSNHLYRLQKQYVDDDDYYGGTVSQSAFKQSFQSEVNFVSGCKNLS